MLLPVSEISAARGVPSDLPASQIYLVGFLGLAKGRLKFPGGVSKEGWGRCVGHVTTDHSLVPAAVARGLVWGEGWEWGRGRVWSKGFSG